MIKYTESYVTTFARGLSGPSEQFIAAGAGSHQSFWSFKIPWFKHSYLLLATTERLIVIDHRKGLVFDRVDAIASYRWQDIGALKLSGLFGNKLVVKDTGNRVILKMRLPGFFASPLKNNGQQVRQLVQTWEQRRALPAAPMFGALPGGAPSGASRPGVEAPRAYS
jgi:hypothetical protein